MALSKKNKDKQIGWIISFSVHALVILLFFFVMAWRAPDPPLPEYGIELNFGLEAGSGFDQPTVTPTAPSEEDEGEPEEQIVEEQEDVVEEPPEAEPVEESVVEELPDSQQEDSPIETQPAEEQTPEVPVIEEIEEEIKPISEPVVEEPKEEPKVEEKVVDSNALYPGAASQGSKDNTAGDVGDPEGSVDSRALYGKSGGGDGGPSLDLAGWRWDSQPNVNDNSKENGKIVFEITVDNNGDVIGVKMIEKTVSATVEQLYRREVEKLTFSQINGNAIAAPISIGKITFIIKSK
jgi:protein TonB